MEIELAEIRDFIAGHPPFDVLDEDMLNHLPKKLKIRYLRKGRSFPDSQSEESNLYIIRSGAVELRDQGDQLIDKLAEGDIYLPDRESKENQSKISGICIEDTLIYLLAVDELTVFKSQSAAFKHQFDKSIQERLRKAVEKIGTDRIRDLSAMMLEVNGLTDRQPVIVDKTISIQNAAKLMTDEYVSSILVTDDNKLVGLVTDRDIKTRCVAAGLDYKKPVSLIMSDELKVISNSSLLSEALLLMIRNKVNHLPIIDNETAIGILTTSDVIRHLSTSPALIASDIYKASSVDGLVKLSNCLPELQLQLTLSSSTAKHIGEVFSSITDAISSRLLELAEKQLGEPPVEYVWLSAGSQARNEQTSYSDQDNALIISDQYLPEHDDYFKSLANFVCDGLNACGYVYCPGNAMASNYQWRQPLSVWKKNFTGWINTPEPKALMLSSIFFDMRPIKGDLSLSESLQKHILEHARNNELFISHMVSNALTHRPPLGFFRNFVMEHDEQHRNTLDIKHRGVVPIVDLARVIALENGIKAINTTERLNAALKCGGLSSEMHANLVDALEYISSLRIRHQASKIRNGLDADNHLPPEELSGIEKNHLKDAFSIIITMQKFFESRYPAAGLR